MAALQSIFEAYLVRVNEAGATSANGTSIAPEIIVCDFAVEGPVAVRIDGLP